MVESRDPLEKLGERFARLETLIECQTVILTDLKQGFQLLQRDCVAKHCELNDRMASLDKEVQDVVGSLNLVQKIALVVATALGGLVALWQYLKGHH